MDRTALRRGLVALACLLLAGCGAPRRLVVGSKNFTEQVVLGEIVAQHIERRLGRPVTRRLNLGGTLLAHQGLLSGQIDLYPEYTGTALTAILKQPVIADPPAAREAVARGYRDRFRAEWMPPLGFDNTFALIVRAADARERKVATVTEAARQPAGWTLATGYEFLDRPDGLAALDRVYRIPWQGPARPMDLSLVYQALRARQASMAVGNSTDSALAGEEFVALQDDRRVFPPYEACLVVRQESLVAYPALRLALQELNGRMSAATMRRLNRAVDQRRPAAEVAAEFLRGLP